jgi:membrane-associated phospholipid phosphatase
MQEEKIVQFIQKKCNRIIPFMDFISYIFYGHISVPVFNILLYFYGINLLKLNIFFIYTEVLILIIKEIFGRKRPYIKHQETIKGLDRKQPSSKSFPSSHAAYAAMLALIIFKVVTPSYFLVLIPILIGLSRMALGVHYLSDVLSGYVLGYILFIQAVTMNII